MFFDLQPSLDKLAEIIKNKSAQEIIIKASEDNIKQMYKQHIDEGISAQPNCNFENNLIFQAQETLKDLKEKFDRVCLVFEEINKPIPDNLRWIEYQDAPSLSNHI